MSREAWKSRTGEDAKDRPCPWCGAAHCIEGEFSCYSCGYVFPTEDDDMDLRIKEISEESNSKTKRSFH